MRLNSKNSNSLSSSTAPLAYTNKTSVRSTTEYKDCYAVDLTLNSTNDHIAVLTVPNTIQIFDSTTLKHISSLSSVTNSFDQNDSISVKINSIRYAFVSPSTLLASTQKNVILVWDTRTPRQEITQLNGCADEHDFLSVTCNNEDRLVAAGTTLKSDENVAIAFWDLRTGSNKQLLGYYTESHSDDIIQVEFSRLNTTQLLSGSTDGLVCLYDVSKPTEDDALEQVNNANGPISKCGFAPHDSVYAITASNEFYIWSTSDENDQKLLVQGDTNDQTFSDENSTKQMGVTSKPSTFVHHLSSSHATIVDILAQNDIKNLLPSVILENKPYWPLLMCDHVGKINLTLVSSDETDPIAFTLDSPHSETVRSATTSRSSFYTCSDDGQLIQWQSSINNKHMNGKQTETNKKSNTNKKKPY